VTDEDAGAAPFSAAALVEKMRRLFRFSLAGRLALIALVSIVALIVAGLIAHNYFSGRLMRLLIDPEIESVLDDITGEAGVADGALVLDDGPFDPRYAQVASGRYYEIARLGDNDRLEVLYVSRSLFDVTLNLSPEAVGPLHRAPPSPTGVRFIDTVSGPDDEPLRIGARVWRNPEIEGAYLFIVAVSPGRIIRPAADLLAAAFAAFCAFCALMVVLVTALQARVGLEPLRRFTRDIAAVRRGESERLEREYAAELAPVAAELNALLDHNREVVERARRHVGNLAHALKTPIAVLKNAASAGDGEGEVLKQSVEEMEAFVERQLRRARVAARAETKAGAQAATIGYRTPVRENLDDLVFMMEQKYDHQKALDIRVEGDAALTFRGEREDLLEMAANLVDNACKYGKSEVIVRLEAAPESMLDIIVEDDGAGLTDDEIARVMTRGARLDEAAPGQGLGLSILAETVELYAGQLLFDRSPLGGLRARLRLPATD
jgi:signal transduction histidine kinase